MSVWVAVAIFGLLLACFIELICIEKKVDDHLEKIVKYVSCTYFWSPEEKKKYAVDISAKVTTGEHGTETEMEHISRLLCEHAEHIAAYRNKVSCLREAVTELANKVETLERKLNEIYIEE